tara:strand:- start:3272 stop:4804 length:1533 start_codon:yes stop_codon:yes gene_type:complete
MKWIGQHIWDFISRFRNDVYLENLSTTSEAELLVVDSDGKVSKKNQSTIVIDTSDFLDNAADNRVVTATGAADGSAAIIGESNLTFDGTTLTLAGLINMTSTIGIELATSATTADVFDLTANSLTTGDAIKVVANAITTGSFIDLAQTDAGTASVTGNGLIKTAYSKTGVIGDGNTRSVIGHNLALIDVATNHANATNTLTGIQVQSSFVSDAGTTTAEGINIIATGGDTNIGLTTKVTDGGIDVKCMSSADTGDYFSISTTTHGATTLTTVDDDATAADLTLDPDGKVVITPADISGDVFHLDADADTDNVVNIDAGVLNVDSSAATTITAVGTAEVAGSTVTLDSAANIELEVGATTNYINTTGLYRGSNIGTIQDGKIPISPTEFLANSYRFHPQYSLVGGGITMPSASVNAYCEVIIPNGYTATACTMFATDVDNDGTIRCHSGSTIAAMSSALATASTFSSGTVTHDFGANDVDGNGAVTVIIEWNPGDTTDILHGGYISITKTT